MVHIFIFHRDLRLTDNTSLINQLILNKSIIPIFIFTPEQINPKINKYFSHNSVQFMIYSLFDLYNSIKKKNGKLYFFYGDNIKVLNSIHKKHKIDSIAFNIDYTPYAINRDNKIKKWCDKNNINCIMNEDYVLYDILNNQTKKDNGEPYLVYTPFMRHCLSNLKVRTVNKFKNFKFDSINISTKYSVDKKAIQTYFNFNENINVTGGRSYGLKILHNAKKFGDYKTKRDLLTYKTTFLGAHNHFSTVSIREVYNAFKHNKALIRELIWRDFYVNITYFFPHILKGQISGKNQSYKKEYDKINWSYNKNLFKKWTDAQTGFPIIDAAMRQLNTTGFMHNRCRMIVASFLTKDLHIDWKLGEKYFASKLVDYDPMSNSGGWQWSTGNGTDAQPYFRIFNPWSQSEKYDINCEYIKFWIPELKNIPNKDIHNWFNNDINDKWIKEGIKYNKPIIDHDEERLETLRLYKKALK